MKKTNIATLFKVYFKVKTIKYLQKIHNPDKLAVSSDHLWLDYISRNMKQFHSWYCIHRDTYWVELGGNSMVLVLTVHAIITMITKIKTKAMSLVCLFWYSSCGMVRIIFPFHWDCWVTCSKRKNISIVLSMQVNNTS